MSRVVSGDVIERPKEAPEDYIIKLAMEKRTQNRISAVLPPHVKLDRFNAIFSHAVRSVKDLNICEPMTIIGGVIMASQLGLEINTPQQQAFLLPFKKGFGNNAVHNAQLIIGYRGMIELVGRTGLNASFYASEVYTNDVFDERRGSAQELIHSIVNHEDRGAFKGAYAIAKIPGRADTWVYLPKAEIEKARAVNKSSKEDYSPWTKWYDEMAKKTAFRRLFKWLPSSVEQRWGEPSLVARAMALDDAADAGRQRLAIESGLQQEKLGNAPTSLDELAGGPKLDTSESQAEPANEDFTDEVNRYAAQDGQR